jgi:2-polyprenyl-3-methyl-5-hydroxy-6-metoxy-1,4-benzoquinol methylase
VCKVDNFIIWDDIAPRVTAELVTSISDVHFGVGTPGNNSLHIIPSHPGAHAMDLGCGPGENLIALTQLGYKVTGIDGSASQLKLAEELLAANQVQAKLILGDVCDQSLAEGETFDMIMCVGVMHFCSSLETFIEVRQARQARDAVSSINAAPAGYDRRT